MAETPQRSRRVAAGVGQGRDQPTAAVASAPNRLPVIGHGLPLLRKPLQYMESLRHHGDIVKFYIGSKPAYAVTNTELARRVLVGEAGTFHRDDVADAVRVMFGEAVANLSGRVHRERRRLLAPSFHRNRIAEYVAMMARVAAEHTDGWREGQRLDSGVAAFDLSLATLSASDTRSRSRTATPAGPGTTKDAATSRSPHIRHPRSHPEHPVTASNEDHPRRSPVRSKNLRSPHADPSTHHDRKDSHPLTTTHDNSAQPSPRSCRLLT